MSTTEATSATTKPARKSRARVWRPVNLTPTEATVTASILANKAEELQKVNTLESDVVYNIIAAVLEKLK